NDAFGFHHVVRDEDDCCGLSVEKKQLLPDLLPYDRIKIVSWFIKYLNWSISHEGERKVKESRLASREAMNQRAAKMSQTQFFHQGSRLPMSFCRCIPT